MLLFYLILIAEQSIVLIIRLSTIYQYNIYTGSVFALTEVDTRRKILLTCAYVKALLSLGFLCFSAYFITL